MLYTIYGATAVKSGCVIAWKGIMTVEVAGLRARKQALMQNNKSSLPGLTVYTLPVSIGTFYENYVVFCVLLYVVRVYVSYM